jgi:hypothetical protein
MPSPSTTIPAVKAAVAAVLRVADGLEGIPVVTGPREPKDTKEWVFFLRAKAKREPGSLGRKPFVLDEDVSLIMRVCSITEEISEARVFELAAAVESALRADATLGGAVKWQYVEELDQEAREFDGKDGHHIVLTVVAKSRIN